MQQATTAHDRPGRRLGMRLLAMGLLGTGVLGTGLLGTGSPPASAAPRPASVVVDYADTGYVCLDPMWASTRPNDERMILSVFEGLARIDAQSGQPVPAAAERGERAPDGRSWTVTLRAGASWTDGTPLRAQDFVRAWKRILDPAPDAVSPWRARLRPLRGVAAMLDADHGRRTLERMGKRLSDLLAKRKEGIDAPELRDLVLAVGLRSVAGLEGNATLAPLLAWGDKRLVPAKAGEVLEALKAERRARKAPTFDAYDAFGVSQGVIARDERTLVVETEQPEPSLPALLARATFVPLPAALAEAKALGTDPSSFVGNGPWRLHQRGPAPAGSGRTPSVVHLQRSTTYRGPFEAKADELRCWTDEPGPDELRRYRAGEVGWLAAPMEEWKKDVEALPGFRTRPTPRVVLLRLRCDGAPFERREARRALALAVDRPALAKALWPAADPATRLLPPGASGAGPGARVLAADKAAALASLAAAGFKPPEREPAFDLRYAEEDQDLGAVAGRL
ncbi:MAG: ABC transporter substrate-binding protein [Planctomycetia bacterium]